MPRKRIKKIEGVLYYRDVVKDFLAYKEPDVNDATFLAITHACNSFGSINGNMPIADYNLGHFGKYQRVLLEKGKSTSTCNQYIMTVRALFKWAYDCDLIPKNPAKAWKYKKVRKVFAKPTCQEHFNRLVAEFKTQVNERVYKIYLLFLWNTGLRAREAMNLRWEDVQEDARLVIARNTKTKEDRIVPIAPGFDVELLKELKLRTRTGPFENINYNTCLLNMTAACKRLGIPKISLHSLRKAFLSRLAEAGVSPIILASIAGHSSSKMTEEYYVSIRNEAKMKAVDKLPATPVEFEKEEIDWQEEPAGDHLIL